MHLPKARQEQLTVRHLPTETLIYDLERHKAHCLNRTSALVWKHCDGQTSVGQLTEILHRELGTPQAKEVVELALEQLAKRQLLETPVQPLADAARVSRREILKKLVVAAVALPVVMTIGSPKASASLSAQCAQDALTQNINQCDLAPNGEPCRVHSCVPGTTILRTNPGNCFSGFCI